tara:strand:+ start:80 stop:577 length:498 start_codon:yes stop_codon:yes gene_type:complete
MKTFPPILIFLISVVLSGCSGWQLRGVSEGEVLSFSAHVSFSRAEKVGRAMPRALRSRGGRPTSKKEADYVINILNERFKRKVISVDPANGYVREVELSLTCEISVRDKDGKLVIPRQILRFSRDYYFDELSAEFTSDNRQYLENDLANDAAESIVLRLDVSSAK